jgi:hypothetical protein
VLYAGTTFPAVTRALENSIVSSNAGGNCTHAGAQVQMANNLSFPDTSCGQNLGDPLLQPVADNGGPTNSQALGPGSPALNLFTGNCAAIDQRGVARPQLSGCDAGAYEIAPPTVATGAATATTIGGSVNPNQRATSYHFDFGATDAYGSSTPTENLPAGNSPVGVSADLSGLAPSTTYHYRLVASNADGLSNGADQTFTTPALESTGSGNPDTQTPGSSPTLSASTTPTGSTQHPGGSAVADETVPRFLSASLTPAQLRKRVLLRFSLSEAAKVTITIESLKPRKRIARLTVASIAGANRKTIARKLAKRRLKAGRYRMTLVAVDAAGNRSKPKALLFRVV